MRPLRRGWVRKSMQVDQRKLDAARAVLGTATDTDTVDAALDAIVFGHELIAGVGRVRAAGWIRDVVRPKPGSGGRETD